MNPPLTILTTLTYDQLGDVQTWCRWRMCHAEETNDALWQAHSAEQKAEMERSRAKAEKRADAKRRLEARIEAWVGAGNLKPGDHVKMAGCRDGRGLRNVLRVFPDGTIECRQVLVHGWTGEKSLGQITTHFASKLRAVWRNRKWVKITDLL